MIDEIAGDNSSTHCLTILVGSGSLARDFQGALVISFCTEANGMLLSFEKGVPLNVEDELIRVSPGHIGPQANTNVHNLAVEELTKVIS